MNTLMAAMVLLSFGFLLWLVPLIVLLLLVLALIGGYNALVVLRNQVRNAWARIDVALKRRYDLIPNLVETVKGYAAHEKETLERVIAARNQALSAQGPKAQAEAENMLTGALKSIFALAEAYPNLKANENFMQLQGELAGTENQIASVRQVYNETVTTYNTRIERFPMVLIAGMFGFHREELFELGDEKQREAPKVSF
jgi:LemA protein